MLLRSIIFVNCENATMVAKEKISFDGDNPPPSIVTHFVRDADPDRKEAQILQEAQATRPGNPCSLFIIGAGRR